VNRQSGVLLPVFSLPGKYGCGGFGEDAFRWLNILSESGFSCWQILPLGVADDFDSPYMPASSYGGNPFFIDPENLYRQGLVTRQELSEQTVDDHYLCHYEILKERRLPFLKKAAMRVSDRTPIEAFLSENPLIAETCRFFAIKKANPGKSWQNWTEGPDMEELLAWQFIQYEFHRQWGEVCSYSKKKKIKIIGDLPFYVSLNSFDVWSSPDQFLLDDSNRPEFVAGVPPDYFSTEGQKWGNPLYDWRKMEADGFSWWKARLGYMLKLYDGVRIDHFRAISSYWSVPAKAESAKWGKWCKGPGKKLIDAFNSVSKEKMILAEDLGMIDDDTRTLLAYSGYPGMAVFQFGFSGDPLSPHLPHNYRDNLVAYTGTHDNNTLLGFWWELDEKTRKKALDYLGNPSDACSASIRALMMSRAGTVIFPVQDLLGFGADTRINMPGRAMGNWRYRLTKDQMESLDCRYYANLNNIYAR